MSDDCKITVMTIIPYFAKKINLKKWLTDSAVTPYNTHHFGAIAQSVEQRIENPCVGSSILPHATILKTPLFAVFFYCLLLITQSFV